MATPTAERVWAMLLEYKSGQEGENCEITPDDKATLMEDIAKKLAAGWSTFEVFNHLRWTEYFDNYTHSEEFCLRMLSRTDKEKKDGNS